MLFETADHAVIGEQDCQEHGCVSCSWELGTKECRQFRHNFQIRLNSFLNTLNDAAGVRKAAGLAGKLENASGLNRGICEKARLNGPCRRGDPKGEQARYCIRI
jgi:hypothetical protein